MRYDSQVCITLPHAFDLFLFVRISNSASNLPLFIHLDGRVKRRNEKPTVDPAFAAVMQQAVRALLPELTTVMATRNDGDAPATIHVWLERFQKQKPLTFSSAPTLVETENWIAHIEKIFEVLGCDNQFKARLATYKLEGDAHSWWRAYKQAKGGDTYVETLSWNDF
ncbi:hypothetical protein Tco_1498619 [Tanacetum coccineum]